jgi:hypothetical protein
MHYSETLRTGCFWLRNPMGVSFPQPVQTGLKPHTACCTKDIVGISPGIKRPGCGRDHLPPPSVKVKERVELYIYSLFVPSWKVGVKITFTFIFLYILSLFLRHSDALSVVGMSPPLFVCIIYPQFYG